MTSLQSEYRAFTNEQRIYLVATSSESNKCVVLLFASVWKVLERHRRVYAITVFVDAWKSHM